MLPDVSVNLDVSRLEGTSAVSRLYAQHFLGNSLLCREKQLTH